LVGVAPVLTPVFLLKEGPREQREVAAMAAVSRHRVRDALEPVVAAAGYDLEDVSIASAGRRSVVRVIVDRDGGIDLDAVADISRTVSTALDDSDVMGAAPYTLEVSSPGVDRPLTEPRHWQRASGRLVRVTADGSSVTGRVTSADEDVVELDVAGETREMPYGCLGPGHIQVEFDRPSDADTDPAGGAL
jgi:ribosome maturation factor RimP